MAWYKAHLLNPFARAMDNLSRDRVALLNDYRALKNIREIKPTIKHYLRSQMASKFLRLDEEEFAPAIFLPVQDFRKAGTSTVHAASRRMI